MRLCIYFYCMAFLNVSLNLLSGNSFTKVAGDLKIINSSLGKTAGIIDSVKGKISTLQKLQGFAAAGTLVKNVAMGVKSIAVSVENLVGTIGGFASQGDRIAKTSRLVGLSVKDYQAFDQAARHAGMSTEEMDSALKKFNVNLGKAKSGDEKAFKVIDAILGGKDIAGFKDTTSLLKAVAEGYTKLGSAEQKAMVSQELFGKSGLKMSELLKNGGEDLQKQIDSATSGFSEQGAKDAEAFDDALQDMRETINSIKISVVEGLFPIFTDLFKVVQDFVKLNGTKIKGYLLTIADAVGNVVKALLPKIPAILEQIVGIIDVIGPWVPAILGGLIAMLPAISQIAIGFFAIKPIIIGIVSVISGPVLAGILLVVAAVVSWGSAIKSVYDNCDMLKSFIVDDVWGTIKDFGNQFVEVAKWMWGGFKSIFIDPWWNFFTALPGAISDLWEGFKTGISEIGNLLYDTFIGSVKSAVSGIKSIVKGIPVLGNLFGDDEQPSIRDISSASSAPGSSSSSLGASVAQAVSESHTTTTSRFAVDFKNMPRGVQVTAPDHGDFDWSRGYVLGGA